MTSSVRFFVRSFWGLAIFLGLLLPFSSASGQLRLIFPPFTGIAPFDSLGYSVHDAGDLNGDGIVDFLIGAPRADIAGPDAGAVFVISGLTGAPLPYSPILGFPPMPGANLGRSVHGLGGDVDFDGVPDFVVGAPGAFGGVGAAYVVSGATGALIPPAITGFVPPGSLLGWSVSSAGMVDGDPFPDVVVGAPGFAGAGGIAFVVSGIAGHPVIFAIPNPFGPGALLGYSVAGLGDIMPPFGSADVIVGAPGAFGSAGRAVLVSGPAGAPYPYSPILGYAPVGPPVAAPGDSLGYSVHGLGDINFDGAPDFIIGAPGADVVPFDAGAAVAYNSLTGAALTASIFSVPPVPGDHVGWSVGNAGFVTPIPDFIVGAPFALGTMGQTSVHTGPHPPSPTLPPILPGAAPGDNLGWSVAGLMGSVDGDATDDIIVGAPGADMPPPDGGAADVYGFCAASGGLGDLDGNGVADIVDIITLINNVVSGGPLPTGRACAELTGDAAMIGGDGIVDISDIICLINNVVFLSPIPCP